MDNLDTAELLALQDAVAAEIEARKEKTEEIVELEWNNYKGTGKCWIAEIDPNTKKVLGFLKAESVEKKGTYQGKKTFLVPLVEGAAYKFNEAGSKSSDSQRCVIVRGGKFESI